MEAAQYTTKVYMHSPRTTQDFFAKDQFRGLLSSSSLYQRTMIGLSIPFALAFLTSVSSFTRAAFVSVGDFSVSASMTNAGCMEDVDVEAEAMKRFEGSKSCCSSG